MATTAPFCNASITTPLTVAGDFRKIIMMCSAPFLEHRLWGVVAGSIRDRKGELHRRQAARQVGRCPVARDSDHKHRTRRYFPGCLFGHKPPACRWPRCAAPCRAIDMLAGAGSMSSTPKRLSRGWHQRVINGGFDGGNAVDEDGAGPRRRVVVTSTSDTARRDTAHRRTLSRPASSRAVSHAWPPIIAGFGTGWRT